MCKVKHAQLLVDEFQPRVPQTQLNMKTIIDIEFLHEVCEHRLGLVNGKGNKPDLQGNTVPVTLDRRDECHDPKFLEYGVQLTSVTPSTHKIDWQGANKDARVQAD